MIGLKFNKWTVLEKRSLRHGKVLYYLCKCDCGTIKEVRGYHLRRGRSRNCGCVRKEIVSKMGKNRRIVGCTKKQKYKQYRKEAINRNFEWNLNFDDFLILCSKNCHYCDAIPHNVITNESKTESFVYQGIDRVNSNIGYNVENCVPCCIQCNRAKNNYSEEEFLEWIKRVYNMIVSRSL